MRKTHKNKYLQMFKQALLLSHGELKTFPQFSFLLVNSTVFGGNQYFLISNFDTKRLHIPNNSFYDYYFKVKLSYL